MPQRLYDTLKISTSLAKKIDKELQAARKNKDQEFFIKEDWPMLLFYPLIMIFSVFFLLGKFFYYVFRPDKRWEKEQLLSKSISENICGSIIDVVRGDIPNPRTGVPVPQDSELFLTDGFVLNEDLRANMEMYLELDNVSDLQRSKIMSEIAREVASSIKNAYGVVIVDVTGARCDIDIRENGDIYFVNIDRNYVSPPIGGRLGMLPSRERVDENS